MTEADTENTDQMTRTYDTDELTSRMIRREFKMFDPDTELPVIVNGDTARLTKQTDTDDEIVNHLSTGGKIIWESRNSFTYQTPDDDTEPVTYLDVDVRESELFDAEEYEQFAESEGRMMAFNRHGLGEQNRDNGSTLPGAFRMVELSACRNGKVVLRTESGAGEAFRQYPCVVVNDLSRLVKPISRSHSFRLEIGESYEVTRYGVIRKHDVLRDGTTCVIGSGLWDRYETFVSTTSELVRDVKLEGESARSQFESVREAFMSNVRDAGEDAIGMELVVNDEVEPVTVTDYTVDDRSGYPNDCRLVLDDGRELVVTPTVSLRGFDSQYGESFNVWYVGVVDAPDAVSVPPRAEHGNGSAENGDETKQVTF